jgi:hypothetical protein
MKLNTKEIDIKKERQRNKDTEGQQEMKISTKEIDRKKERQNDRETERQQGNPEMKLNTKEMK